VTGEPARDCSLWKTFSELKDGGGQLPAIDVAEENRSVGSRSRPPHFRWLSGDILADVITNAGLFVLPSDMEGMSLALLDAMGAGLCVLASDTPENCEVIQDVGFTFRRADVVDLQRMLELLLSEPELRDSTGIRAQTRVRQHYLWENVTQEIATIYSEMMQPHSEKTMAHGA
jgi:glycosyltransferase involved in cell wall biosynthesis